MKDMVSMSILKNLLSYSKAAKKKNTKKHKALAKENCQISTTYYVQKTGLKS